MRAVLMYNFRKDKLKDFGVKATQKDFNALKGQTRPVLL